MRAPASHALHRWTRWVLAAWLCVALGSVLSPWARAQASAAALEPVCGVGWVPSPAAQDAASSVAPLHGLDCPLCLPLLAPPPATALGVAALAPASAPAFRRAHAPWVYRVAAALPARGPPALTTPEIAAAIAHGMGLKCR